MYEGTELRKRTKLTPVKEVRKGNAWSEGTGEFYDFQRLFKSKYPETCFENEYCEDGITECSLTGFTGSLKQLMRWQTRQITFEVYDGRINVIFKPGGGPAGWPAVDPAVLTWVAVAAATVVFIYLNFEKYQALII